MDPYLQEILVAAQSNRSPSSATAINDPLGDRPTPTYFNSMSILPHTIIPSSISPVGPLRSPCPNSTPHHTVSGSFDLPLPSSLTDSTSTHSLDPCGHGINLEEDTWDDGEDELEGEDELVELSPGSQASTGTASVGSPKKRARTVLARGRACIACRGRKLKCSGENPCLTCFKTGVDCHYREITRRKPRKILLEERVVELEALILSRGEDLPPTKLRRRPGSRVSKNNAMADLASTTGKTSRKASAPITVPATASSSVVTARPKSISKSLILPPTVPNIAQTTLIPRRHSEQLPPSLPIYTPVPVAIGGYHSPGSITDIQPHSILEANLIRLVLPYTPHLSIPIHPQRFLALLTLSTTDPSRPHPSLLYILFAEAVRILEAGTPAPLPPLHPPGHFRTSYAPPMPDPLSPADKAWLLSQVRGSSNTLLERARTELDRGFRTVDRPFDLTRAAIGIARYLYSLGRFIEGWNIPVMRLAISCGLHRISGNIIHPDPPDTSGVYPPTEYMPRSYASTTFYLNHHAYHALPSAVPPLRMRQLIIPPPRDEIDLAERVMTFWAAKCNDYAGGVGWGWSLGLSDDECTTEWPWGTGVAEIRVPDQNPHCYRINHLFDAESPMYMSTSTDSTYVLSVKSQCLVNRASHLNDLPQSSIPYIQTDGRLLATHIPPLSAINQVESALQAFRAHLPPEYLFPPPDHLDPFSDPWYILLHTALFTAEMLTFREKAVHDGGAYHRGIGAARGLVQLVQWVKKEQWVHVDMMVAINLSLAARMLHKEADRLRAINQGRAAKMAADEAEILRLALAGEYSRWMPMAGLHALIVGRVRDGMAEKEGEYERV